MGEVLNSVLLNIFLNDREGGVNGTLIKGLNAKLGGVSKDGLIPLSLLRAQDRAALGISC